MGLLVWEAVRIHLYIYSKYNDVFTVFCLPVLSNVNSFAMFVLTITKDPRGVCRWADALLTLFVLACAYWCPTHIVLDIR
jgi:hypothetical protein